MELSKLLNPQQLEAVQASEGPVLILAGAGSGKTRVITYRVAHLIEVRDVRPEHILAVTFTNKAADQMKFRVKNLLRAARSGDPLISTFHSLCVRILRREIEALNYSRDFTIYDEADQLQVVKAASKDLKVDERLITPKTILSRISHAKSHGSHRGNTRPTCSMSTRNVFENRTHSISMICLSRRWSFLISFRMPPR